MKVAQIDRWVVDGSNRKWAVVSFGDCFFDVPAELLENAVLILLPADELLSAQREARRTSRP